jgi:hypothetical protein
VQNNMSADMSNQQRSELVALTLCKMICIST